MQSQKMEKNGQRRMPAADKVFLQWCRDELVLSFIHVQYLVSWDRTRLRKSTTAETQTLTNIKQMRLFIHLFAIIFYTASCCNCHNNNDQNHPESNTDTSQIPELKIVIEADDIITLPELDGIEVYLENNSAKTIKVWENVNPSGLLNISFLFETEKNEELLIEPVILNRESEFSKVVEIETYKKFKLNPQLTHWVIDNSQIEKADTIISGKLKAYYTVRQAFEKDRDVWEGEIFSNEVQLKLKHNIFVNAK